MGKPTGFMEIDRQVSRELPPEERIQNFREFHVPLHPDEQQTQGARCMDCGVPFCQSGMLLGGMYSGCPLNNLVPEWNDLVYRGQWEQAVKRLIATNRYPEFTSRVCPALCEAACTCGMATGSPVTVKENERAIVEYGYENGVLHAVPPPSRTGKKVAVVGTGPSGLSVADLLNKRGHKVTMYERSDRPGGLLMYGIPNMKLEKWVIDRRIRILKEEGIDFLTGVDVGRETLTAAAAGANADGRKAGAGAGEKPATAGKSSAVTNAAAETLASAGKGSAVTAASILRDYDAVVLACGAKQARGLNVPFIEQAHGIHYAVDYLTSQTKALHEQGEHAFGVINAKGKHVVIVGGGDTGNDCCGTAIRQGAKSVTQIEMMPEPPVERAASNPWPEWPKVLKVDYGQQEAIRVFGHDPRVYETTIKAIETKKDGSIKAVITS